MFAGSNGKGCVQHISSNLSAISLPNGRYKFLDDCRDGQVICKQDRTQENSYIIFSIPDDFMHNNKLVVVLEQSWKQHRGVSICGYRVVGFCASGCHAVSCLHTAIPTPFCAFVLPFLSLYTLDIINDTNKWKCTTCLHNLVSGTHEKFYKCTTCLHYWSQVHIKECITRH